MSVVTRRQRAVGSRIASKKQSLLFLEKLMYRTMYRTRIYIDGFNLYHGMLKDTPYKWLDLVKFANEFILPETVLLQWRTK